MIFNTNVMDNDECMKSPEEIPMIPRRINALGESVEILIKVIDSLQKTLAPIMAEKCAPYIGADLEKVEEEMQAHVSGQLEAIDVQIRMAINAIKYIENKVEL